jgi:uncharacterized protein
MSQTAPHQNATRSSMEGPTQRFGPLDVVALIGGFRDNLRANQGPVNRLNVYPVPDGDTGTNMALTVESVVAQIESSGAVDMASVCQAISHGSLMGARGNSGVILSQILRGLAGSFRELETVGPRDFASALTAASIAAYGAVMKPIEGTILTVVRSAAEGASDAAGHDGSLIQVLESARRTAGVALAQTPDLLPVLKAAGVVDAGGAGFCLLLDAALTLIDGRPSPVVEAPAGADALSMEGLDVHGHRGSAQGDVGDVAELRYEVMYFLEAPDESIAGFKDLWASIGDSIVVVGGEGIWNCHIHTNEGGIGPSIEAAIQIGRPHAIRVTDLHEQVEEERWVREASGDEVVGEAPHQSAPCMTAVVAVTTGDGIRSLFLSYNVQRIVTGGQSMNPSTQQLLEAVEACPAQNVVILPNNKNIIPVAEQVAPLTSKAVRVIATRGVTEGLAAVLQYDPEGDIDTNAASMRAAAASVVAGEITRAVRDSSCDVGPIKEGDYLGIARDGGIVAVESTMFEACRSLLKVLITDSHEIVTILEGEGSSKAVTRQVTEWLADADIGVESEVHRGGQPLYPYFFGVE